MVRDKDFIREWIPVAVLMCLFLCLVIKSFFGFGWDDEGYYLSVTHRFFLGEIPIYDEWNPGQLSGMLLLPFYALYRTVVGSGEGIVIFFRLLYLVLLFWKSMFAFLVIKKITGKTEPALLAAAFFLVYSTENKALFSYSDLAVSYLGLALLLLLWEEITEKKQIWVYFAAGISFVLAVFANPYNIIVYFYFAGLAVLGCRKEKNKRCLFHFGVFTGGCCLIGFGFLGYLLFHAPLQDLLTAFKYFVNYPGHSASNVLLALAKWLWYAGKPYNVFIIVQAIIFLYVLKKLMEGGLTAKQKKVLFRVEIMCAFFYCAIQYLFMDDKNVIGIAFIPISVMGLLCFIMSRKKDWRLFLLLYVPGILMSIAFQCASDTGIFAMITGFVLSAMASVVSIFDFMKENLEIKQKHTVYILLAAALCYTFAVRLYYCKYNVYEETYDSRIISGPYRGILTDARQKKFYEESMQELNMIARQTTREDHILILGNNMWMYLCLDRGIAAPATFRMDLDHACVRPYFAMHPDKMPTRIYANDLCEDEGKDNILFNGEVYSVMYSGVGKIYERKQ